MTYIEFFDNVAGENIAACLACAPERVVLIGDNHKRLSAAAGIYKEILKNRGKDVDFLTRSVGKNNLSGIISVLQEICEKYPDAIIDLTGGDDLYLVAAGKISERLGRKVKTHRLNIRGGKVIDTDEDGQTIPIENGMSLSIAENALIYGGTVVLEGESAPYRWDLSVDGFSGDIRAIWDICKKDPRAWNSHISFLERADKLSSISPDGVYCKIDDLSSQKGFSPKIMSALSLCGAISNYEKTDKYIHFNYKNRQIRKCLTRSGLILELYIYLLAKNAKDKGKTVYTDAMVGISLDWDGIVGKKEKSYDTRNEIDVMLMHGVIPVFVSCKNGQVETDELYKLSSVADRFGASYAKKAIFISDLPNGGSFDDFFLTRAKDMNIQVIRDTASRPEKDLIRIIENLWK